MFYVFEFTNFFLTLVKVSRCAISGIRLLLSVISVLHCLPYTHLPTIIEYF